MALSVALSPKALKDIKSAPTIDRDRIFQRVDPYAADPSAANHDVMPLVGREGEFRLRAGDWRAASA